MMSASQQHRKLGLLIYIRNDTKLFITVKSNSIKGNSFI